MVTHDARSASIADRILFLADGNIVKELPRSEPSDGDRGDGGDRPDVRSIALRGLWARKLRTFLTAFAIVLGIATVSGTFVLTDSITHAFDTIFSNIYRGTDASITGKSAVSLDANHGPAAVRRVAAARR